MPSRRDFLRTAAVVAAGVPLVGCRSSAHSNPVTRDRLGFALVGLGSLSTNQIAPALQQTRYCRLAGIVTGTPAKAERWKAQYGIPERSVYNYETMERLAEALSREVELPAVNRTGLEGKFDLKLTWTTDDERAGWHVVRMHQRRHTGNASADVREELITAAT